MAYPPRTQSASDVYHVITRGIGQLIIFEDDKDREHFLQTMREQAESRGIGIWAWCLMSNHVHFLLHGNMSEISKLLQTVKASYARYFNVRHERSGSLFQGRFTSVPIQTDEQLIMAVEYIHQNPVKAGGKLKNRWSSYADYFDREDIAADGKKLIGDLMEGPSGFAKAHATPIATYPKLPRKMIDEDQALEIAKNVLGKLSIYDIGSLDKADRDDRLASLKDAGLSVRQISRLTSIGHNIVARARHPRTSE